MSFYSITGKKIRNVLTCFFFSDCIIQYCESVSVFHYTLRRASQYPWYQKCSSPPLFSLSKEQHLSTPLNLTSLHFSPHSPGTGFHSSFTLVIAARFHKGEQFFSIHILTELNDKPSLPLVQPFLVPVVLFLMLASGINTPMFVMFNAFKCMGYFS